ncbi:MULTISPECIES: ATP-binding protein [Bacillota]|nr:MULTISPECIES: ATP-binding protein [Bacillota]
MIGMRRSGKSYLLMQIKEELLNQGIEEDHIIYLNFEFLDYDEIETYKDLNHFIEDKIKDDQRYYLMFDEIQNIEKFEKTVNSLRAKYDCSIFLTGSNLQLLSKELSTLLTGRYIEFEVFPFSFKEMIEYYDVDMEHANLQSYLQDYMKWGGLPQRFEMNDELTRASYIQDVYHSILYKDIITRFDIKDIVLLEKIIDYVFDSIGQLFSTNNVVTHLGKTFKSVKPETVYRYLDYLAEALLIQKVERYDIKGKKILSFYEKYYAIDLGFANIKKHQMNIGSSLENIVYIYLKANAYQVYIGKTYAGEVDFIAQRGKDKKYIQVCYILNQEDKDKNGKSTYDREFDAFTPIKDNCPKYVLSTDSFDMSKDGIIHQNIYDFLLHGFK